MSQEKPSIIRIEPDGIGFSYTSRYRKEEDGMYSWYIPAFEIYFSSKNIEEGKKRGHAMVTSFFNFWVKEQGIKAFLAEITKLGFQPVNEGPSVIRKLLNRERVTKANFKSKDGRIPEDFESADIFEEEGGVPIAI